MRIEAIREKRARENVFHCSRRDEKNRRFVSWNSKDKA